MPAAVGKNKSGIAHEVIHFVDDTAVQLRDILRDQQAYDWKYKKIRVWRNVYEVEHHRVDGIEIHLPILCGVMSTNVNNAPCQLSC
jgi:hypothetical protein